MEKKRLQLQIAQLKLSRIEKSLTFKSHRGLTLRTEFSRRNDLKALKVINI
jgi:hypothetical protein